MSASESSVRISIVVPFLGDNAAFEESLVSVLENRPRDADVWVVHDGSYRDPFDLEDEVRFLEAESGDLPTLVAAAAKTVRGRYLHVIAGGVRATYGWADAAMERFEHAATAIVAPVARTHAVGEIVAAGWTDSAARVTAPAAVGCETLHRRDAARVCGAYLRASFWRTTELRAATCALATRDTVAAEFAWPRLLTSAGWRCVTADTSTVIASPRALLSRASLHRGRTLLSLAADIDERSAAARLLKAAIAGAVSPSSWLDVAGQMLAVVKEAPVVRSLRYDQVHSPRDIADTIRLPAAAAQYRRAA